MVVLEAGGIVSSEGWVDGVALVGREGEGVLRLDFIGVVWRGLRRLFVTLSQCHGPAWELINRCPQPIHRQFRRIMGRS